MSIGLYLSSIFSVKKIFLKNVSLFSFWDNRTKFDKTSALRDFSKCYNCLIGRYSSIGRSSSAMNVIIGNYTVIARDCNIGLGAHPTNLLSCHSIFYKNKPWSAHPEWVKKVNFNERKITYIGNDVWIGAKSTIMDGVKIGNGAIIAACAVVTKDVPPYAIVGGCPAKTIRFRYSEDIIMKLEDIKWWDMDDSQITKHIDIFHKENLSLEDLDVFYS